MKRVLMPAGFTPPHLLSHMAENTPILVALSGGADSVALLALLVHYAKQTGAPLSVAHINHKLRGKDADRDRDFCRALADAYRLPFYLLEVDVTALAKQNRRGVEEEARWVRYDFFAKLMREHQIPLLATAHHADDNAETVLLHMTRGSGLRGLCGIAPARPFADGKLIRPLLEATKEDILSFCEDNELSFVTDETNSNTEYARNRVRHNVIPELRAINPAVVESITRLSKTASAEDDYLRLTTEAFLTEHQKADGALPLSAINASHPALAARAIAYLIAPHLPQASTTHVDAVLRLASVGTPHSSLDLGNGLVAVIENECLALTEKRETKPQETFCRSLHEGVNLLPEADMALVLSIGQPSPTIQKDLKNIYKKETTTRVGSATIYDSLIARPRAEGDVILAGGMHKKVKKLMCDSKLPLILRRRLPLVCDKDGILWIPLVTKRDDSVGDGAASITLYYND